MGWFYEAQLGWLALLSLAFIPVLRYLDTRSRVPANRVGWFVK